MKNNRLTAFLLTFLLGCSLSMSAVDYCASSAFGYGASATGGGSATPVLVSSVSELSSALNKGKNKVIIITKSLTFTKMLSVQDGANVTLLGLPGVTLTSLEQTSSTSGILYVKRFNNLIIRNLTFVGPGAYDCDGNDLLCFESVTNAWVDHCDFQDGCDGNFDNKKLSDNVTISWCRFRYLKAPRAGGSGGSDDHRFTNLLGSSASDKPSDGTFNYTWAYCWWDDGCKERMVRCRNCELHFLNCYWNSSVANYYVGPENAKCYFDGCTFEGKANSSSKIFKSYGGTNACKFVGCSGNLPSNAGTISAPSYSYASYTFANAAAAKTAVTNASCGAGATLTVTTAGAISSTCDGGAAPVVYTVTWNATANGGTCGTATTSVTSGNAIGSLPEASKSGYTFNGWYTAPSGGTKISSSTTVTANVTYYAQFTSTPVTVYYTVIWDANGGTCGTASSSVESGHTIGSLPVASKGGCTFDGWFTSASGGSQITASQTVTANVTYYAHYTSSSAGSGDCFEWHGDPASWTAGKLTANGKLVIEADPTDESKTNINSSSSNQVWADHQETVIAVSGNDRYIQGHFSDAADIGALTISAANNNGTTGTDKAYLVLFCANSSFSTGVTGQLHSAPSYNDAQNDAKLVHTFTPPAGTKYFRIYRKISSNVGDYATTSGAGDGQTTRIYRIEACTTTSSPTTYTLSYDENGGSGTMADVEGTNVTVAANGFTAPTGYAFLKWNSSMNGAGTDYTVGQAVTLTEDLTLYAIWQTQTYTVTLNAESGTGGTPSVTATFDAAMPSITIPTRSGYIFRGYYTGTNGTGTQYYDENGSSANSWAIAANTELHAYWEAGSVPTPSGCDLHFWFVKAADASDNSLTNDGSFFSDMIANSSTLSGSLTIDGNTYSITGRSGDAATFGSFTIPSGKTGIFYALAVSSGNGTRQINLVSAANTYELPVAGGSDSYKRLESETLPAGTYTIAREGSNNVRLGIVVVKVCDAEAHWGLRGEFNEWAPDGTEMEETAGVASVTIALAANSRYEFKFKHGSDNYGNTGAIATDVSGWPFATDKDNCVLYSGPAGNYTFSINTSTYEASVTYPAVSHPCDNYVYFVKPGDWNAVRIYNYTSDVSRMSDWDGSPTITNTTSICGTNYYYCAAYPSFNYIKWRDNNGHESTGLSTSAGFGKYFNFAESTTEWRNFATYTISFNAGGGTGSMASLTDICPNSDQTLTVNSFTRSGYVFANWTANVATKVSGSTVAAGSAIANSATLQEVNSDIVLTAQWTANTYTIELNNQSATGAGTASVTATYNSNSALLAPISCPYKTGYFFDGYYTEPDGGGTQLIDRSGNFLASQTGYTDASRNWIYAGDVTLYAKWTELTVTLTISPSHIDPSTPTNITYTVTTNAPTGTTIPYLFAIFNYGTSDYVSGYLDGDHNINSVLSTTISANMTEGMWYTRAVIIWSGSELATSEKTALQVGDVATLYTVTYNANGGSVAPSSRTQASEGASITLDTPTRTDYTFQGWYVGATKIGDAGDSYIPTADVTAYAAWKQDCAGGGGPTTLADINFKDASWTGKTFSQGNTTTSDVHNGIYFYAKNTDAAKQFSLADNTTKGLTFPNNNMSSGNYYFCIPLETGEIDGSITVTLKHGYSSNKASYKYVFVDGRATYVAANTNGTSGTQVTDANTSDTEITFNVTASNVNHKGHLIIGRYGSGFTQLYGVTVTTGGSGSTCYYVTYDGNGAEGGYTNDPTAYDSNDEVTVLANGFTKTGYEFQGWANSTAHRDAGTVDYNPAGTFNITANTTLYAVWALSCSDPAAPTAFATTATTGTTATFSITDDANAASYDLYYATGSPATPTAGTVATTTVTTKTPTIEGLAAAQTYTIWVRSVCDATHKSAWVALTGSTFTTGKAVPTSYNVSASAEGECEGGMTAKITLSGSQSGVNYQLKNNGVNDGAVKAGTGSALEWTGKGAGVYTVWAVENASYTGLQMNKTATIVVYATTAINTQPATSVSAEVDESFTLGTGMVAAGNALTYRWYTCGSTGTDTVFISGATSATYTTSQSIADTYYYRVRVEGTCGDPVLSNIITVIITSLVPPSDAPTISVQPAGDTYCYGDALSTLSVTATGSGTVTYQWKKDGVDIPSANAASYNPSEAGTYTCVVTNTEVGKSARSITSDAAVITIKAEVATPTITQTENAIDFATATAGATIYYTTDGTDPTTGSASGTSYTLTADCTIKAYAVKDGCASSIATLAATFDPHECAVLISYTLTTSGTANPTIAADEDNLVGGSADYKVSSTTQDGGYKLNNDQYFGLTLASGQFKAGDKVTVTITKKSDQGDHGLHLCTSKTGAAVLSIAEGDVVVGDNVFTLAADCDAIYVARSSSCNQNPYVKSISVCRSLIKYTVTFDKNNVSATGTMSDQSFYDGFASKLKANTFALAGYDFAGWATSPSGSKVYDDKQSITPTDNMTLYALWKLETFKLTNVVYPAGYGTVDIAIVDNIPPTTTTSILNNTYTVNGITVTATPAAQTDEYDYAFSSWSGLPATVTADAEVTANFTRTARTYLVTLNTNGGTINSGNVTGYTYGEGATLPTDVTRTDGWEFKGWYDNVGLSGSPVTEISTTEYGNKEYWAKWILCPSTNSGETVYKFVTKSSGLGTGSVCAAASTYYDMTTANALSELVGGALSAYATNTNRLLYAESAFTFANGDGGLLQIELDCPIESGDIIRFINSATGSSYHAYVRHTSSSTSADQITLESKHPTITSIEIPAAFVGEHTLYLVRGGSNGALISYFEIIRTCPLTFDAGTNGGTVGGSSTQIIRAAKTDVIALPHAFKEGYKFAGWYTAPIGGSPVSDPYTVTGATTLYAQFEDCPHDGTMYKFEVGTGLTDGAVTANDVAFEFTTSNYLTTMLGGTLTTDGSTAAKILIANTNSISINADGAYLKVDLDCALEDGDIFKSTITDRTIWVSKTASRPSSAGAASSVLPIGALQQTQIPATLVGEKTLYLWKGSGGDNKISYFEITRPKRTNITLNATGAYNHYTTSVVATYDQAMPEIATLPMRIGYVFDGYYDAPNGAGTQYYNGLGVGVRNWDKDVWNTTLYASWKEPCELAPTLTTTVPVITIWDGQKVDMALVQLTCDFDTTGIHYSLLSASEAIAGCTFSYFDERIYIQGTPALGNASTMTKTITFTMTNDCSPASTYNVTATIRIYPAGQRAKIAYIVRGTKGGDFNAYNSSDASSSSALLTYLGGFYDVTVVNGYATKDAAAIATYYDQYDLLIVTDYMETPEGYTNAIGTLIDKKPILSFEAYVAGEHGSNWHIGSNPKDPSPKVQDMKILCAGHAIFKDAESIDVINDADTTVHVLSALSGAGDAKGLQGFVINEAPDYIFLATIRDNDHKRDLVVCCERQVVFPARLILYGINYYEMGNLSPAGRVVMHQMIDYLLTTDETKVADCSLVFDNGAGNTTFNPGSYSGTGTKGDGKWSTAANWAPGYNIIPTAYHPTRIIAECHVDVDNAHAGSVKVNQGRDEGSNPIDGKLIVEPYGGLTIAGIVAKVNDTRYASPTNIKAEDLLIKSDASHNGAFVYGNKESDVRATVQYYSSAEGANTSTPTWQYIGIPFQANHTAISMYYAAWMCRWTESTTDGLGGLWQWVDNNDILVPFEGYCITQAAAKTYTFAGKLNPPTTQTLALDNCDADGYAFAANSWTAPIKIQEMEDGDFVNAERSIYIYHTGSYASWETKKDEIINAQTSGSTVLPGQYAVIPIHSSPYLGADSVIPSMQGFFVKTTAADAELSLVYNRTVYDATYFKTSTQPMRAPQQTNGEPEVMKLMVVGDSFGGDQVHILARGDFSDEYEDGWDGRKIEGDASAPMLGVVKAAGDMAVAAIPTTEGRYLSFRAGEDMYYTFRFDYDGEEIYLYDLMTEQATRIRTGNTYSFTAVNKTPQNRFLITANPPKTPTDIENVDGDSSEIRGAEKFIRNDKLFILHHGIVYDGSGKRVTNRKEVAQ